jgi:hypothetical protein
MGKNHYKKWDTPVSHVKSLVMESLVDMRDLEVTLIDARGAERKRYLFRFSRVPTYRSVLEQYSLNIDPGLSGRQKELGWTRIIDDSDWVNKMEQEEGLITVDFKKLIHYVIATEDGIVEILCENEVEIIELESLKEGETVGKTRILHHPEDREEIDKLFSKLGKRK